MMQINHVNTIWNIFFYCAINANIVFYEWDFAQLYKRSQQTITYCIMQHKQSHTIASGNHSSLIRVMLHSMCVLIIYLYFYHIKKCWIVYLHLFFVWIHYMNRYFTLLLSTCNLFYALSILVMYFQWGRQFLQFLDFSF